MSGHSVRIDTDDKFETSILVGEGKVVKVSTQDLVYWFSSSVCRRVVVELFAKGARPGPARAPQMVEIQRRGAMT